MKLINNQNVFFEKTSHSYWVGDKELQGATTLLRKHGLMPDYSGIPDKVLEEAARKGTALHEAIESYDNGESVMLTPFLQEYRQICQENGLKFLVNELLISDEETVASMIDGVYEGSTTDSVILVDYKSTNKVHWRSLSWQLSLYKVLFERQFPGVKVEALKVLHLDKKEEKVLGLYPVEEIPESEVDALLQAEREGRIYIDLHEEPSAELVLTDQELAAYVVQQEEITRLKEQIKKIEDTLKGLDNRVKDYMLEHGLEKLEGGGGVFTLKKAYTRTGIDTERLKRTNPGLYEMYKKETTVSASISFKQNK